MITMKLIRKECKNKEGKYCDYLSVDDGQPYCIYSVIECNPSF